MKTKQKKELSSKTVQELKTILVKTQSELLSARHEHAQKKLKNTSSLSEQRKLIARILTIIREKGLLAGRQGQGDNL